MRKNICRVLGFLTFASLFITGCSSNDQTTETSSQETTTENDEKEILKKTPLPIPEDKYLSVLEDLEIILSSGIEESKNYGNQVLKLWGNILDKKDDPETDLFTKEKDKFVDLNTAFQKFYGDKIHKQELNDVLILTDGSERLAERIKVSDFPAEYEDLKEEALLAYDYVHQLMDTVVHYLDSYEKTKVMFEINLKWSEDFLKKFSDDLNYYQEISSQTLKSSQTNTSSQSINSLDPVCIYLKRYINLTPQDLRFDSSGVAYYQDFRFSQDADVSANPLDGGLFYDRLVFLVNESAPELYKATYGKYFTRASNITVNDLESMLPTLKQIFQNDILTQKRIIDYLRSAGSEYVEITSHNLEDPLAATYTITIKDGASLGDKLDLPDQTVAFLLAKLKDYGATYTFNPDSIIIQRSSYK